LTPPSRCDEEAAAFYEKYGSRRIPDDLRLYRKVSEIERDLAERDLTDS
jgi:hypothetical protein